MATITVQIRGSARTALAGLRSRLLQHVQRSSDLNRGRLWLWIPVLFGTGIGCYFALPVEPGFLPAGISILLFTAIAIHFRRSHTMLFAAGVTGALLAGGFSAAQIRNAIVSAPVLIQGIGPVRIAARVVEVEPTSVGMRLTLDRISVAKRMTGKVPARIRISVRSLKTRPLPGDRISALAILQPPPEPSIPGGFDFARKA